jgi:hypothetical protein
MKSYLRGFVYFGKVGTAVECVVHDISDSGARLKFLGALPMVDTIELHIPVKGRVHRANVLLRAADEIGVKFVEGSTASVRYLDGDGVIRREGQDRFGNL